MPNNSAQEFRNFLFKRSQYLYRLENGAIQDMVAPYKRARKEISDRLTKLGDYRTGFTLDFRIQRLESQLGEINGLLRSAALDSAGQLESTITSFVASDADAYAAMLSKQFGKIGIDIVSLPYAQIDRIANSPLLGEVVYDKLEWMNEEARRKMRNELTQSIIQGEDMQKATARLTNVKGTGLTDMLIRRRAEIIARSEIQYVSNQVARSIYNENQDVLEGVQFSSSLDNKTCLSCASLDGQVYYYKNGEDHNGPFIPIHPLCFIDHQIPIYTSKGIKHIRDIKRGDRVLTHKGHFKKVTEIIRYKQKAPEVVTIWVEYPKANGKGFESHKKKLTVTKEHPLFINGRWIKAEKIKKGDLIKHLAARCKRCKKLIPFDKIYCSRSCISKDITERQWNNPEHRKNVSKKNSEANLRQYASGERDSYATTLNARKASSKVFKKGMHPFQTNPMFGKDNPSKRKEVRKLISESKLGDKNPMRMYPEIAKANGKRMVEFYKEHPEKHPNRIMALKGHETGIERKFKEELEKRNLKFKKQYHINRYFVDFAFPDNNIAIEVDGNYWHNKIGSKRRDIKRQKEIIELGWTVLRYKENEINENVEKCVDEVCRVINNHNGNYEFLNLKIVKVKKWIYKKENGRGKLSPKDIIKIRKLYNNGEKTQKELCKIYNLSSGSMSKIVNRKSYIDGTKNTNITLYNFSVEDDESYIANGMVSHNCRCTYVPLTKSWKQLEKEERVKPGVSELTKGAFTGDALDVMTYDQWLKTLSAEEQIDILGPARYKLWDEGKVVISDMAKDGKVYTIKQLEDKTEKLVGKLKAEVRASDLLPAEVRAKMTKRQLTAIDSYVPSDLRSRTIAELTERDLAAKLGAEHIIGKRPFDVFLDNEFIEVKTFIRGRGEVRIHPSSMLKKEKFVDTYKVRSHLVVVDKRPDSETYGKMFYRRKLGNFNLSNMTEVKDYDQLKSLLKQGARKEPIAFDIPVVKLPMFKKAEDAAKWLSDTYKIKEVDFAGVDLKVAKKVTGSLSEGMETLGIKPKGIKFLDDFGVFNAGKINKTIAEVGNDGIIYFNKSYFKNLNYLEDMSKFHFKTGHFITDDPMHIVRHEMGHLKYFKIGGTDVTAERKISAKLLKDIGESNIPRYVSKYGLKNEGEFYAEMMAWRLNGEKLHPLIEKYMKDIEKNLKRGIKSKSINGSKILKRKK